MLTKIMKTEDLDVAIIYTKLGKACNEATNMDLSKRPDQVTKYVLKHFAIFTRDYSNAIHLSKENQYAQQQNMLPAYLWRFIYI